MYFIIDRIEEDKVILETEEGNFIEASSAILPPHCKASDIIKVEKDEEETKRRKESIKALMQDVWE